MGVTSCRRVAITIVGNLAHRQCGRTSAAAVRRLTASPHQSLITVDAVGLDGAARALETQLKALANARIITLVSETNRLTSLRGRTAILAVVDHDSWARLPASLAGKDDPHDRRSRRNGRADIVDESPP